MSDSTKNKNDLGAENYEANYSGLPFENILRIYRKRNLNKVIEKIPHQNILEIGCGPSPFFENFSDFSKMIVVEPGMQFFRDAVEKAHANSKISVINDFIENISGRLTNESFNCIVLGGFLHEIDNPVEVLQAVMSICSADTRVYSFVPNAKSFHRLLANEMGLIDSIFEKSEHDKLFQRKRVFELSTFNELFLKNGFQVIDSGSYFIKPFSHQQMNKMLKLDIIDNMCTEGLYHMSKFLPELGAELWNICTIDDQIS